jgi:hypothetical protein
MHGVRGTHRAADDPVLPVAVIKAIHHAVIASPACDRPRAACSAQMAHNVAVRVEDANLRHRRVRDVLLAAGLAQQALRREGRGQVVVLVAQDRRQNAEASVIHSHDLNGPAK